MKTLIWKEWREQRLFFFLAVGIIVLSRIVPYFLPKRMVGYETYAVVFGCFILPILFSLFLGAISFTGEFIKNTKSFLLSQPLTSKRLFWTKFFSILVLLFVLVLLTLFVFLALPFKGTVFYSRGDWVIFLLVPLSMVILYSAACFSSLLLKNSLTAIICTPFVLLFGILLVLPLSVVLFLISSSLVVFNFFAFSLLIATFLIFSFLTWQKAIVKDVSPAKTIFATTAVILLISFGSHAIANLVASQKLNKTIQQAKAEGIKLTLQEIIPPPVSDKDNAALVYQQAFDLIDKLKAKYKEEWKYMPYESQIKTEKLTLQQKNVISRIMKDPEFARFYALLERAVNLPSCRFNLRYEDGPAMLLPHLSKMRSLARLLAARTYILAQEGRYKEAMESATTGLRLGNSLADESILISQLVRIAADQIAMDSFRQLLNNFNGAVSVRDYRNLISAIDRKDKSLTTGLEGELALGGGYFFELGLGKRRITARESEFIASGGKKNIGFPAAIRVMSRSFGQDNIGSQIFWTIYCSYLGKPVLKEDYAFSIQGYSTLIRLSQKTYFSAKNETSEWERKISITEKFAAMKHIVSLLMLPALGRANQQQSICTAGLESLKLATALKIYKQKHGNYPDMLLSVSPEIIPELPLDPFTGKDYIYRKEGKGFILYSVGPNERDDNGVYDPKHPTTYDIAWKVLN
ncbi:MAG: hypothetical protein WC081_02340 [Candidatus Ratteibacteria bacterium]|jgi:ABC-type transport system involved in multi-copper enzyme maturation permease subunit